MMMGAPSDPEVVATRGYRYQHGDRPLDGYTVQRAAGRGAFGEVYYAISDSGREVALKVVQAYEQVELRGIGQCMNLKSPHLVSVFDVREGEAGQPVVIMEFVAGPSLRELLDESPSGFGAQKAAFFLREIGKGLTYLHDCGIVHRDLKPANIFYENGYVKIGDYGLSKAISASHRSAQTVTVGTLHYMAPEVGAGCYDRSVDIYALGALLYEMLTGQPPFFGVSPAEVLMKHLNAPVRLEGIEEPFATVLRRALAKDPAMRYQSVQEMVEGVFGAEHIRQSVSCFAPTSLTMVAGRVANRVPGLGMGSNVAAVPLSSRAYDVNEAETIVTPAGEGIGGRLGRRVRRIQRRVHKARKWLASHGIASPWSEAKDTPIAPPALPLAARVETGPAVDPLSKKNRRLLALIATVGVAVAAGIFADDRSSPMAVWFVILGTIGATAGLRWASVKLLPDLANESRFLRRLAAGGLAAAAVTLVAFPAWGPATHSRGWGRESSGHTLAAICLSLLVVDWSKRMSPTRASRVLLGDLLIVGIVATVFAAMLDAAPEVVIGVLCATCMAVQILTTWTPRRGRVMPITAPSPARPSAQPLQDAVVATPRAELLGAVGQVSGEASLHGPAARAMVTIPSVFQLARRCVAAGRCAVIWPIRLLLHVTTVALTGFAFVLSMLLAFDLPGWLASGRPDPRVGADIHRAMGVQNWAFVLRSLGGVGFFVLACLALVMAMWVRRSRGTTHLLRGVVGTAMLLAAPFVLAHGRADWGFVIEPMSNGWSAWQELVQSVPSGAALRAGIMLMGALVLLLWPAAPVQVAGADSAAGGSAEKATVAREVTA